MSIHKFERPDLDHQILTAMEQLDVSQKALRFFMEQRRDIRLVREAVAGKVKPGALDMLDEDLTELERTVEEAEAAAAYWQEILDALLVRARRS